MPPRNTLAQTTISFVSLIIAGAALGREPKDSIAVAATSQSLAAASSGGNVSAGPKELALASSADLIAAVRSLHSELQRYGCACRLSTCLVFAEFRVDATPPISFAEQVAESEQMLGKLSCNAWC